MFRHLAGGYYGEALAIHEHAYQAALRAGDAAGQIHTLSNLGAVHLNLGNRVRAIELLSRALALLQTEEDPAPHAAVLANLGASSNDPHEAANLFRQALEIYRRDC